jgi:hypothetical protein
MRFDEMTKMGIKVVADFAIMDKEDIDSLFPEDNTEEGKTKFDRKRFEKALQQAVPQWLLDSGASAPPAAAQAAAAPAAAATPNRGNQSEDGADAAAPDALAELLQRYMLGDQDSALRRIGIRTPEDVLEMDEEDLRGLRFDKFSARRFGKLLEEMRPAGSASNRAGGGMPNFSATAPAASAGGGGAGGGGFGGLGGSAAWMPATRTGPTPEISMRQGTQHALNVCAGAPLEAEQTLSSFYDHWHATTHVVTAAQKRMNSSQRLRQQQARTSTASSNQDDGEGKESN